MECLCAGSIMFKTNRVNKEFLELRIVIPSTFFGPLFINKLSIQAFKTIQIYYYYSNKTKKGIVIVLIMQT